MRIPKIWLMRQAGRYLPEYKKIRNTEKSFLDLCYNPTKASTITLQPLKRFNLDAAIIFSDILVVTDALGISTVFKENLGPVLKVINNKTEAEKLEPNNKSFQFKKISESIKLVKKQIPDKTLIGFIGGSWTVCAYILEGRGKCEFEKAVDKIHSDPKLVEILIEKITEQNLIYLQEQIKAGAELVQIFESHAGKVPISKVKELIIDPTNYICKKIKKEFPNIRIIGFPRGSGSFYERFIEEVEVDIISCDQNVPLEKMKKWQEKKYLQGNLDPLVLLSNFDNIEKNTKRILEELDISKLIFNLGHGVLPETPVENVKFLVDYVNSCLKK